MRVEIFIKHSKRAFRKEGPFTNDRNIIIIYPFKRTAAGRLLLLCLLRISLPGFPSHFLVSSLLLGVDPAYTYIAQGLVIVIAVALDLRKYLQKK